MDLEKNVNDLQQRIEEINVNYVNLKNELLHAKTELSSYELLLQKECRNRELLEEEKQSLLEKVRIITYYQQLYKVLMKHLK